MTKLMAKVDKHSKLFTPVSVLWYDNPEYNATGFPDFLPGSEK